MGIQNAWAYTSWAVWYVSEQCMGKRYAYSAWAYNVWAYNTHGHTHLGLFVCMAIQYTGMHGLSGHGHDQAQCVHGPSKHRHSWAAYMVRQSWVCPSTPRSHHPSEKKSNLL
eukprot:1158440-Pelagomonas_calceolata.AAC.2